MKAVFFESHGGTEVLQYGDLPMPRPEPGEVVIQVRAAAMNFNDIWARQGMPGHGRAAAACVGQRCGGRHRRTGRGRHALAPG
ncbi:MAG: hypothetical protein QM742_19625 [Aquabacterium sp.]